MPLSLHVVLVHPEIPWNTGNAGRTCLAAGARLHLVRPLGFVLTEAKIRRSGLDYWERVNPAIWDSWADFEAALPELGEPFFLSAEGERSLWDVQLPECPVLVFGRESDGLPTEIRARYRERLFRVPMVENEVRSLNLSTTVGIVVFEALRQQSTAVELPQRDLSTHSPAAAARGFDHD